MSTVRQVSWFTRLDHWLEVQLGLRAETTNEQPKEKIFVYQYSDYLKRKDEQLKHFTENPSGDFSYSSIYFTDIYSNGFIQRQVYETDSIVRVGNKKYRVIIRNTTNPKSPRPVSLDHFPEHESENQQYALYIADFNNDDYGRGEGIVYTASKINKEWQNSLDIPQTLSFRLINKLNDLKLSNEPIKGAINWLRNDYFQRRNTEWFQFT